MAAVGLSDRLAKITPLFPSSWQGVRYAMRSDPWVMRLLVVFGGLVSLALVGVIGYLAWGQRDATTLLVLVNLVLSTWSAKEALAAKGVAQQVREQTNGTQAKLVDAVVNK